MYNKVIIIQTTHKPHTAEIAKSIFTFLQKRSISADIYTYDGQPDGCTLKKEYDLAVSLGGDGTVLFAARYCAPKGIPVFPINLGEFGFIAGIEPDVWEKALADFLAGTVQIHERMLLSIEIIRQTQRIAAFDALNDIVISGKGIAKLIDVSVSFNTIPFGVFRADGVIVSSPTGSTAYSAASGGPILDPSVSAFVLTPIAAFSLSNRPIVLPASGTMRIEVLHNRQKDVILSIDGQELLELCEDDSINIRTSEHSVKLIGCTPEAFYTALRSKLSWSGSLSKKHGDTHVHRSRSVPAELL